MLSTPTLGSMVGLVSAVGTLQGGMCENRFSCPPPKLPANLSYKYSLAWPGYLILMGGGSLEGLQGSPKRLWLGRGAVYAWKMFFCGSISREDGCP